MAHFRKGRFEDENVINLHYLYKLLYKDKSEIIKYLQDMKILASTYKCPKCGKTMVMTPIQQRSDGFQWRCREQSKENKHDISRSIRKGTWIFNSKLTLEEILLLTYFWVEEYPQKIVMHEMQVDTHTIVDWYSSCREVCVQIILNDDKKIGGEGTNVEMGELNFGKRMEGQWVFGGVCRETKECFLILVPAEQRSVDTLICIIKEKILPGTTIFSDCWKAYKCLQVEEFHHLAVNQSISFKDSDTGTGCHTNTIESLRAHVKNTLPKRNRQKVLFESYLCEYMYRRQYVDDKKKFEQFLNNVARLYVPIERDD